MNTLLTITDQTLDPAAPKMDSSEYYVRHAARAVLLGASGQVYLLKINLHNYTKLPGGGIEEGEDIKVALARELMEEVGCQAEVLDEVGEIIEYRDQMKWVQTSYCFIARQVGKQQAPNLEQDEIDEGAEDIVVTDIDEAIKLLESDEPDDYEGKFIQIRDLCFLRTAKDMFKR